MLQGKESGPAGAIAGAVLHRAAAAVVHFCDYHRTKVILSRILTHLSPFNTFFGCRCYHEQVVRRAVRAESLKELGILDSGMASLNSANSAALYYGSGLGKAVAAGAGAGQLAGAGALGKDEDEDVSRVIF